MPEESISITVKFFASLREYGPVRSEITVPTGSKIRDVLERYEVPFDKINLILMVNGKPHQTAKTPLKEGDVVAIFPQLAGG